MTVISSQWPFIISHKIQLEISGKTSKISKSYSATSRRETGSFLESTNISQVNAMSQAWCWQSRHLLSQSWNPDRVEWRKHSNVMQDWDGNWLKTIDCNRKRVRLPRINSITANVMLCLQVPPSGAPMSLNNEWAHCLLSKSRSRGAPHGGHLSSLCWSHPTMESSRRDNNHCPEAPS